MNSLDIDLKDKIVIVKSKCFKGTEKERRFKCLKGFGCSPATTGTAVWGRFLIDGEECRIEGTQIEKLYVDTGLILKKE